MPEPEFSLVEGDALDYGAYVRLQKEAYAELLKAQQVSDAFMSEAFYRWKYHTPEKPARIAVVHIGGEMVAANAMYPVRLRMGGKSVTGWQSCDTATAPAARGKGCFKGCLKTLEASLEPDSVFFGFPNQNSIRGFVKLGWQEKSVVTTWVNPLTFLRAKQSDRIEAVSRFSEAQDVLAGRLVSEERVAIERSAAGLNWRYTQHPLHDYACFVCRGKEGGHEGILVMREAEAMGRRMAVVMEALSLTAAGEREILRHAAAWAREKGLKQMVHLDTDLPLSTALLSGCAPVPARFVPKRQVLMGAAPHGGEAAPAFIAAPWRVQMGDWDAF